MFTCYGRAERRADTPTMKQITYKLTIAAFLGVLLCIGDLALAQTVVKETTTSSAGTVSEFGPETITIHSETSPAPVRYSYSKTTTYVDENGAPVSIETVKSGLPVTVYYVQDGERRRVSKVIVRRAAPVAVAPAAPAIEVRKTTTTTTTTDSGK